MLKSRVELFAERAATDRVSDATLFDRVYQSRDPITVGDLRVAARAFAFLRSFRDASYQARIPREASRATAEMYDLVAELDAISEDVWPSLSTRCARHRGSAAGNGPPGAIYSRIRPRTRRVRVANRPESGVATGNRRAARALRPPSGDAAARNPGGSLRNFPPRGRRIDRAEATGGRWNGLRTTSAGSDR